ncbi:type VII secretion system-associated protein (plasmid) [Streptomyces sp. BHT-5-2]|uniref:type VII secretion system-associated protein n=1 Tax=Streptomyces sp. BHT-5-2 TaxID=2866715 RepID=UPI001C8D846D|nr:type VII secretion system-associated protein [Streptomyces sp. BHT-5-2]QZL07462.1 type VII secretion system-associated protein [Streptomyces sp. BHT-5-2]
MDDSTLAAMTAGTPVTGEEMPVPPPEVVEAAREAPDHWLAMVDLTWSGKDEPPLWAVIGQWRSGPDGAIAEWRDNPEYRPSPQMLDWADPTDPVDRAVQLSATGYGPESAVYEELAGAEVSFLVTDGGEPLTAASPEGAPVVPVYTAAAHLESAGRLLYDQRPAAELVEQLPPGHALYVNPSGPVSMVVEAEPLRAALAAAGGAAQPAREPAAAAARWPGTGAGAPEPVAGGRAIGKPARSAASGDVVAAGLARGTG